MDGYFGMPFDRIQSVMYAIISVHSKVREVCDVDQNGDSRKANTNMGKRFQELFRCKLDRAKRGRGGRERGTIRSRLEKRLSLRSTMQISVKKNALRIQWFVSRSADTSSEK